jgi:hypothetical protein
LNLGFLGDAFDHWKGALFGSLQEAGIVQEFAADPMASDLESWKPEDFKLLAQLLRIKPAQIIAHRADLQDRASYFGEISHEGDLFLDPDTGVATSHVSGVRARRYVKPSEVKQLLATSSGRLVIVYQHVRAQKVSDRVETVLNALRHELGKFNWCSYESGTVAMLFLARAPERPGRVRKHFVSFLGRHASDRIRGSEL